MPRSAPKGCVAVMVVIIPSHGRFVGASSLPFSEYRRRPGDRVGLNWRIPNVHGKRAIRHVVLRYQLVEVVYQCSPSCLYG